MILLDEKQIVAASLALALAFQRDPLFIYFFPSENSRLQLTRHIFELQIRQGLLVSGTFVTSAELEGVMIMLPSEKVELDLWTLLKTGAGKLLLHISPGTLARMLAIEKALIALRQRIAPQKYAYLSLLGVQPVFQGRGHAGRLLKNLLEKLDDEQKACYLETENLRNVSFYESFGFRLVEKTELAIGVTCWAMLKG
jgi:ribosomal protein S18 acetylase RimI-like enzyme